MEASEIKNKINGENRNYPKIERRRRRQNEERNVLKAIQ
jgi:hypothetical protein